MEHIYETYIYIYMKYIKNIHKYLCFKIIRNTGATFGGRAIGSVFLIILYRKYLWIFLIDSLYIPYISRCASHRPPRWVVFVGGMSYR